MRNCRLLDRIFSHNSRGLAAPGYRQANPVTAMEHERGGIDGIYSTVFSQPEWNFCRDFHKKTQYRNRITENARYLAYNEKKILLYYAAGCKGRFCRRFSRFRVKACRNGTCCGNVRAFHRFFSFFFRIDPVETMDLKNSHVFYGMFCFFPDRPPFPIGWEWSWRCFPFIWVRLRQAGDGRKAREKNRAL